MQPIGILDLFILVVEQIHFHIVESGLQSFVTFLAVRHWLTWIEHRSRILVLDRLDTRMVFRAIYSWREDTTLRHLKARKFVRWVLLVMGSLVVLLGALMSHEWLTYLCILILKIDYFRGMLFALIS
jgi:hypothetical protein